MAHPVERWAKRNQFTLTALGIITTLVLGLLALLGFTAATNDDGDAAHATSAPPAPGASSRASFVVSTLWPYHPTCDAFTAVAMPAGHGEPTAFQSDGDVREKMVDAGAGSWQVGSLTLELSTKSAVPLELFDLKPHILRRDLSSPVWTFGYAGGGCGGGGYRTFGLDLDGSLKFADLGLQGGVNGQLVAGTPDENLGPDFMVKRGSIYRFVVEAGGCEANYEWELLLRYRTADDERLLTQRVGPFATYGVGNNTSVEYGEQGSGGAVKIVSKTELSGTDTRCSRMKTDRVRQR